jgi:peptidoglycan hydrolase-like protein with peptidoglycan-binding domain
VRQGDTVEYGQSLGTQSNRGLAASAGVHVHIEMDTAHRQALDNYLGDLGSGRLPVQTEFRADTARAVADDGTFRLGQSNDRIRDLQRVMSAEGYLATADAPLAQDGVYRPDMQGALLDFQRAHGLPQTGNIDPATLRMAPARQREGDANQRTDPEQAAPTAPGHPDHPDHRPLPARMPPAVNQDPRPQAYMAPSSTPLSATDQQMFAKIRADVPTHLSDDVVASALLAIRQAGIDTADRIRATALVGDRLYVAGATPGFHAVVDVTQPQRPAQESARLLNQHNQQQEAASLALQQDPQRQSQNAPSLKT